MQLLEDELLEISCSKVNCSNMTLLELLVFSLKRKHLLLMLLRLEANSSNGSFSKIFCLKVIIIHTIMR
jgi:hypothetical protein